MSILEEWSVKVAREVAPAEEDLAPELADAFVQGGRAKRDLFSRSGSLVGGFAAGETLALLPVVYQAVSTAAPVLVAVLTAKPLVDFLGCIKTGLTVSELGLKLSSRGQDQASKPAIPTDQSYVPLRRAVDVLQSELRRSGLGENEADLVTFRVLKVFLEDPRGALQFVQALGGAH